MECDDEEKIYFSKGFFKAGQDLGMSNTKVYYFEDFKNCPPSRYGHSSTLVGSLAYVFGGLSLDRKTFYDEILIFDLEEKEFVDVVTPDKKLGIKGRHFHSCVLNETRRELVFGFGKSNGYLNDLVTFNVITYKFGVISADDMKGDVPSKRYGASAVVKYDDKFMYVFGGYSGFDHNDVHEFNFERKEWKKYTTTIPRRFLYCGLEMGNNFFVIHGLAKNNTSFSDVWKIKFYEERKEVETTKSKIPFVVEKVKIKKKIFSKKKKNYGQAIFVSKGMKIFLYGRTEKKQVVYQLKFLDDTGNKISWKENPFPFTKNSFFSHGSVNSFRGTDIFFFGGLKVSEDESEEEKKIRIKKLRDFHERKQKTIDDLPDDTIRIILSFLRTKELKSLELISKNGSVSIISCSNFFWDGVFDRKYWRSLSDRKYKIVVRENEKSLKKIHNAKKKLVELTKILKKRDEAIQFEKEKLAKELEGKRLAAIQKKAGEHKDQYKCVAVGDGAVGKTSLLYAYAHNSFPEEYVPTIFENYNSPCKFELYDRIRKLQIWDTAGEEEYCKLRPLAYPETDFFLLVFSVVDIHSLENIYTKWYPEVMEHCPFANVVLVGTKIDLYDDVKTLKQLKERGELPVTRQKAERVARDIKAVAYCATSAKTQKGLKEVFEIGLKSVVQKPVEKSCGVM